MKRLIFVLLLIQVINSGQAQVLPATPQKTSADYLKKSKSQKTWGWILAGAGVMFIVVPSIEQGNSNNAADTGWFSNMEIIGDEVYLASYITGALCVGGSIALFSAAKRNKEKAGAISVIIRNNNALTLANRQRFRWPGIGIRINF